MIPVVTSTAQVSALPRAGTGPVKPSPVTEQSAVVVKPRLFIGWHDAAEHTNARGGRQVKSLAEALNHRGPVGGDANQRILILKNHALSTDLTGAQALFDQFFYTDFFRLFVSPVFAYCSYRNTVTKVSAISTGPHRSSHPRSSTSCKKHHSYASHPKIR